MPRYHYKSFRDITMLARSLRKNMTPSEKIMWDILRRKKLSGYKFLRQHPVFYRIEKDRVEFFIADFYCAELKLVIEIDGPVHDMRDQYDKERDMKLESKGIFVVRIKNEEFDNTLTVLCKLDQIMNDRNKQMHDK